MKIHVRKPSNPFKHDIKKPKPTQAPENTFHNNENMEEYEGKGIKPRTPLTKDAISQLKELVQHHKKEKRYKEAIQIIEELIGQKEGSFVLLANIEKIKILLESGEIEMAKAVCGEIIDLINSDEFTAGLKTKLEDCDIALLELAELFLQHSEVEIAISIAHCIFTIIKCFYEKEIKLARLASLGDLMQDVAKEMAKQERGEEFKTQYPFLQEALEEMQNVKDNVDLKQKCKHIAWFLKCLGFCCDEARDFHKSICNHEQAIILMKTIFSDEFNQYKVVGVCYNNIGATQENTENLDEAKVAYEKALQVYKHVSDWKAKDQKAAVLQLTTNNISRVGEKLSKSKK